MEFVCPAYIRNLTGITNYFLAVWDELTLLRFVGGGSYSIVYKFLFKIILFLNSCIEERSLLTFWDIALGLQRLEKI